MDKFLFYAAGIFLFFGFFVGFTLGGFNSTFAILQLALGVVALVASAVVRVNDKARIDDIENRIRIKHRTASVLSTVGLALMIFVANYYAGTLGLRLDTTTQGAFSLAPASISTLAKIDSEATLVGIRLKDRGIDPSELFALYKAQNDKIKTVLFDPRLKPNLVEKYKLSQQNAVYIAYKGSERRLDDISEKAITDAFSKMINTTQKKVYYVVGHEEPSLEDAGDNGFANLAKALRDEGLLLEELDLGVNLIPEDAASIILAAPKRRLAVAERQKLIDWTNKGNSLIVLHELGNNDTKELAKAYKIEVSDDVVVDTINQLFFGATLGVAPLVSSFDTEHPISQGFEKNNRVMFNMATSLRVNDGFAREIDAEKETPHKFINLAMTSESAWGETDTEFLTSENPTVSFDEKLDRKGPFPIAIAYENSENNSKVIVYGDSSFVSNAFLSSNWNKDLLLNTVNWSVDIASLDIRPRSLRESHIELTEGAFYNIAILGTVLPELFLLLGIWMWFSRSNYSKRRDLALA